MMNTDMKMKDNESLETFRHTQIDALISLYAKSDPHEIAFIFLILLCFLQAFRLIFFNEFKLFLIINFLFMF